MVLFKDIKKAIAFGLIFGVLFNFCTFCFASEVENVDVGTLSNVTVSNGVIVERSGQSLAYFELESGYIYHVTNISSNARFVFYSNGTDVGSEVSDYIQIDSGVTKDFYQNSGYVYLLGTSGSISYSVTREPYGLGKFVLSVATVLSFVNLNNILAIVVPILAISVLVGLGVYFLYRLFRKIKRARGGI